MYRIGVDVGGTNTDAVLLRDLEIVDTVKTATTPNVMSGVVTAVGHLLSTREKINVSQITVGTTHLINAVLERRRLCRVSVLRLGGPCAEPMPPFCQFPTALGNVIKAPCLAAQGGVNFDGSSITEPNEKEVKNFIQGRITEGIKHFVVSGVFSPVFALQEQQVGAWINEVCPEVSITLSHTIGQLGLLARENASILNESLKPLCRRTLRGLIDSLQQLGIVNTPLFLTQNDGTLLSVTDCLQYPILTFNSGATNSMRGAAFLCGEAGHTWNQAIVIDIGGTSTDGGLLINGFPKPASSRVRIAGVPTNFNVPELVSIALGGGSKVYWPDDSSSVQVGPSSVGNRLETEAMVFGGSTSTLTDVAVGNNPSLRDIGNRNLVASLSSHNVQCAYATARAALESIINSVRVSSEPVPVILVGGGSALFAHENTLCGLKVIRPQYASLANAMGAALAQLSACRDQTVDLSSGRDSLIEKVVAELTQELVIKGAKPSSVHVVEKDAIGLPYIPGHMARLRIKVVGDRDLTKVDATVPRNELSLPEEIEKEMDEELPTRDLAVTDTDVESEIPEESLPTVRDGTWYLSEYDVHCIALGAIFLGCGGGGDPEQALYDILERMRRGCKVRVVSAHALAGHNPNGEVISAMIMGSPTVNLEKFYTTAQMQALMLAQAQELPDNGSGVIRTTFPQIQNAEVKSVDGVITWEIGGLNGMSSLINSAVTGAPVVDVDCMGRAFPELQMVTPAIAGLSLCPAVAADEFGNCVISHIHSEPKQLEDFFRAECAAMGCMCTIALAPLTSRQTNELCIPHSISRARHIGHEILKSRRARTDVCEALANLLNGRLLADGKIIDVERNTSAGFARGRVLIRCLNDSDKSQPDNHVTIHLQNEFLSVTEGKTENGKVLATTPNLIVILERNSGQPLQTGEVRYGLAVRVYVFPAPPQLCTEKALKFVGPQAFGLSEQEFCSVGDFIDLPTIV